MYKINTKKYLDILSIESLYWGIANDIIPPETAIEYADEYLRANSNSNNSKLIDLLILDDCTKDCVLKVINSENCYLNTENHKRVIRYIILEDINKNLSDAEGLLEQIESVYADFDYPNDMEKFIPYMPAEDEDEISHYTETERQQHILKKFRRFLKDECNFLK